MIMDYIQTHGLNWQVLYFSFTSGDKIYKWAIYWPTLILVIAYIASSLMMQKVIRRVSTPDPRIKEFFDEKLGTKKRGSSQDIAEQMQKQMSFMNIILVFIAFILSAGALLYFFVQNILMMLEYKFIPKLIKVRYTEAELEEIIRAIQKDKPLEVEAEPAANPSATFIDKDKEEEEEIIRIRKPFQKK